MQISLNIWNVVRSNWLVLLALISAVFSPVTPILISVLLFIFLDTITGLIKAHYSKEPKNSNSMKRGLLPKLIVYTLCILIVFVADKYIVNQVVFNKFQIEFLITKIIACILIFIEIWSIDENFKAIFGYSLIDYFVKFVNFLRKGIKDKIDNQNK